MRTALLQLTSTDQPAENLDTVRAMIAEAAAKGAGFVLTPEVTNCLSASGTHQEKTLRPESEDRVLAGLRRAAKDHGIWLLIGSLALKSEDGDGRFANRSILVDPQGGITARYDKIHMFDVQVSETETYRESARYRPGEQAVLARTSFGTIGMTICYDVRFPQLYSDLARAGASILTVPSAFSPATGAAHWEPLLRARAIETGCYVLAPAQTGTHPASHGRQRTTYGRSLAIDPWGKVLIDAGTDPGIHILDLDGTSVTEARGKVPSLSHIRPYNGP
ncbi:MAG: carbon-nitrogen hydrolase family protein [Pseudomonadota bacterium]